MKGEIFIPDFIAFNLQSYSQNIFCQQLFSGPLFSAFYSPAFLLYLFDQENNNIMLEIASLKDVPLIFPASHIDKEQTLTQSQSQKLMYFQRFLYIPLRQTLVKCFVIKNMINRPEYCRYVYDSHKTGFLRGGSLVIFFHIQNVGTFQWAHVIIKMGNKNIQGLPSVITKNWQSISSNDDVFKSKLTSECVREQIINISNQCKIEELRNRMKQTNPYICRIVFYSHISEDNYYVYTDEMRNRPYVHNLEQWKIHKQNIVDAFITLSKRYGPTRVCNQMIGVDLSGQIKVWINPNPALDQVWYPCASESQMIADILRVCRSIKEESTKNKNQQAKEGDEVKKFQVFNNNLTLKNYYQMHKRKQTGQIKQQSTKLKLSKQKKHDKFIPPTIKNHPQNTGNLKISDSKTKSSQNSRQRPETLVNESITSITHNMSNSSQIEDSQSIQERNRTESFGTSTEKKNQRRLTFTCNNLSLKIKNKRIQPNLLHELQKQNSNRQFLRSLQKLQKIQNQSAQRIKEIKKALAAHKQKKTLEDIQVKSYTISSAKLDKKLGIESISKLKQDQKLSNKLGNVVQMPVRQERESQLTYDESKTPLKKPKNFKQMTISQEFFQFFGDQEKKQIATPTKLRKRSGAYQQQFRRQVNELFDCAF